MSKSFLKSKLFWLGIAQLATAVGMLVTGEVSLEEFLLGGSGILTIVFRFVTTQGVHIK